MAASNNTPPLTLIVVAEQNEEPDSIFDPNSAGSSGKPRKECEALGYDETIYELDGVKLSSGTPSRLAK